MVVALTAPLCVSSARAQTAVAIDGTTLRFAEPGGSQEVEIGCRAIEAVVVGSNAYAACGAEGVVHVRLTESGAVVQRGDFGAPIVGIMVVDGVPWGRSQDGGLRRIDAPIDVPPAPPPSTAPQLSERIGGSPSLDAPVPRERYGAPRGDRPPPPIGHVTRVEGGYALIALDRAGALEAGGAVEFLRRPRSTSLQLESERDDLESVGRGVVEAAAGTQARVRIEVDTAVAPEMFVRPTPSGGLLLLPPEPAGMATLSFRLRPFIPMGILGFGAINDVSIGYTTDFGLAMRLEANGFAFGFARRVDASAEHMPFMPVVHGYVGAVTRYFELGLGLGWSRSYRVRAAAGDQFNEGFSALTMLRVGTEDGLSLRVRFTLLVRDVWEVGDLYFDGRVPVTHGVWFVAGGGGGNTGVRYGEAGVRFLVMGNGRGGSVFLNGTLGVGMIEQGANFSNAGPMVGLGLDARL